MPQSPLLEEHKKLNARLELTHGWEMVSDYGDMDLEYQSVRNHPGIIDLTHIGKFQFNGKDAVGYLHNRLTNSIDTLKSGQGCYACLLDFKGRMISDLWVHRLPDFLIVTTNPSTRIELYRNFQKFIFSEDVTVSDMTEEWTLISVQGPKSGELLNRIFSPSLPIMELRQIEIREMESKPVYIIRTEWTGQEGYHLIFANQSAVSVWSKLLDKGREFHINPFGLKTFDRIRIEAGIPVFGRDMDQDTIPLEAGLNERAISLTKGCYPGQEIIARITNLSHPKRILTGLEIQSELPLPDRSPVYFQEDEIGMVTSSCYSPGLNKIIGLGYFKWDYRDPGGRVEIRVNEKKITAVIVSLPFIR